MYPVLEEFQRLTIGATEAEVELSNLRKNLQKEKEDNERYQEAERALRAQLSTLNR